VFLEWKPVGDEVDETSAVSGQKDTDWTMVHSDPAVAAASYKHTSQPC